MSNQHYVHVWADGINCNVRMDGQPCLWVIVGCDGTGRKEFIGLADGYRESAASWDDVLTDLQQRGLTTALKLAIGSGALEFWKAVAKHWPQTDQQRCWVHKTANVLEKRSNAMWPKVKEVLHNSWQAETRGQTYQAFDHDHCLKQFSGNTPKAMECLAKDKASLLAFYA